MDAENPRHCRNCGWDLKGVSYRAACPGCGTPVLTMYQELAQSRQPPPEPPPHVGDGSITRDVPCLSCGYTLRGLSASSMCPECGTPASQSLMGGYLRFAGRDYLERLSGGLLWVVLGLAVRLLGAIFLFVVSVAGQANDNLAIGAMIVTALIAISMSTWGWWQVTSEHTLVSRLRLRGWARWSAVVGNGLELMAFASAGGISPSPTALTSLVIPGVPCISLVFFAVWVVSIGVQTAYVSELMRRLPNPTMASTATVATWLNPGLLLASILCFFVLPFTGLGAFIFYFIVIDRCRAALAKARDSAGAPIRAEAYEV
ncbi:MAG TPA: hypothetical protein VD997_06420 [Phycisphaerales bacterium]|nr:hypothetical protein [Phycisphaerales bacterium]